MENQTSLKPHYNLSMSRRTRRPTTPKVEPHDEGREVYSHHFTVAKSSMGNKGNVPKSNLKQLIEGRCSLAQHFKDDEEDQREKQKQTQKDMIMVRKSGEENQKDMIMVRKSGEENQGTKLRKMVRNYGHVLKNLVKVKQWRKLHHLSNS